MVAEDDKLGIRAHLEDGTVVSATHVIGADGKWSKVRQSFTSLNSQAKIITCPSFGVHLNSPTVPECFKTDGIYVINPRKECMFYIIAASRPSGGLSISMVCYDETLERYPWLEPPSHKESGDFNECSWDDQYSALPETMGADKHCHNICKICFRRKYRNFITYLTERHFEVRASIELGHVLWSIKMFILARIPPPSRRRQSGVGVVVVSLVTFAAAAVLSSFCRR